MTYIDIAVYAVPTASKNAFKTHAEQIAPLFRKHGAIAVADCWGADVPGGEVTSLPMAVKCRDEETVAFSCITWPSKAVRDTGMPKAMADMRALGGGTPMPFDGKRMIFGGFEVMVEA